MPAHSWLAMAGSADGSRLLAAATVSPNSGLSWTQADLPTEALQSSPRTDLEPVPRQGILPAETATISLNHFYKGFAK
jgi:hypothetical protein